MRLGTAWRCGRDLLSRELDTVRFNLLLDFLHPFGLTSRKVGVTL
jgi:hypothetical protein